MGMVAYGMAARKKSSKKKGKVKQLKADFLTQPHNGHEDYREASPIDGALIGGQVAMLEGCGLYKTFTMPVGRRVGKTTSRPFLWLNEAVNTVGIYRAGFFAQDHTKATAMAQHTLEQWGGPLGGFVIDFKLDPKSQDRYIKTGPIGGTVKGATCTGIEIYFWSGSHPAYEKTRGDTHHFNRISLDEAQLLHENILDVVNAKLADVDGALDVTGTPFLDGIGNGWFEAFFNKGLDPTEPDFGCMSVPSHAGVGITIKDRKALDRLIARCRTEEAVQQEIYAKFITDRGAVFSRINEVICLEPMASLPSWYYDFHRRIYDGNEFSGGEGLEAWVRKNPAAGVRYLIGVDWARVRDASVISVMNLDTMEQDAVFCFRREDYEEQVEMVSLLRGHYNNATIYADNNGVGDSMVRTLQRRFRGGCVGVKWGADKGMYVRDAQQLFNHVEIKLIDIPAQRGEFKQFMKEKSEDTGRVKYKHPPHGHDDFVDCLLMLAEPLRMGRRDKLPEKDPEPEYLSPMWMKKWRKRRRRSLKMRGRAI